MYRKQVSNLGKIKISLIETFLYSKDHINQNNQKNIGVIERVIYVYA